RGRLDTIVEAVFFRISHGCGERREREGLWPEATAGASRLHPAAANSLELQDPGASTEVDATRGSAREPARPWVRRKAPDSCRLGRRSGVPGSKMDRQGFIMRGKS